ncbi:MAG: diiron oxygenase [Gammaproteobacteria bacterium]|nr:diiron oxygenase [Gammaproteobacteria bacterium]
MATTHPTPTGAVVERADQLARHSTPYRDPTARVQWERLNTHSFWLPETALSLHGVAEFDRLPLADRQRLSHYEFIHFLQAGLWLEGIFLERLGRAAAHPDTPLSTRMYHLHELREEAGHSLMFLEFFRRSGLDVRKTAPRRDFALTLLGRRLPFDSALFWGAILLGEEVPDRLNRYVRLHAEGVCPVAVELSVLHSTDEARHIAYGLEILQERLARMPGPKRLLVARALTLLLKRFTKTFYYPPQALYVHAALPPGPWAERAHGNPVRRAFVARCLGSTVTRLRGLGLPINWP